MMRDWLTALSSSGIIAVARIDDSEEALPIVKALLDGGVSFVEFAFSHRSALRSIERAAQEFSGAAAIGAGTVLDPETARAAILAGAKFIVTPSLNSSVIEMCRRYSIPVFVGALTPTEILKAWEAGADIVKVFPANVFGPRYLKDLHGPFPQVRLMPTGGIDVRNVGEYLRAGALAVCAGGSLVPPAEVRRRKWQEITSRAKEFVAAVKASRQGFVH